MLELTIRLVFSLAVVTGLLALLAKFGARRFRGGKDAMVQVLHRQHLSRGAAVSVVTVGGRVLVLGTTEHQVRVLTELDPDEVADEPTPGEVLTLVPAMSDPDVLEPTFVLPETVSVVPEVVQEPAPAARPAGAHRAAAPKGGRRAARPAPRVGTRAAAPAATGPLAGSVLSPGTWRQAFALATRRAS